MPKVGLVIFPQQRILDFAGDCWVWMGFHSSSGYARFRYQYVHRLVWEAMYGPIPPGLWVLHHCDNRSCINPKHLWLGTVRDNAQDALRKGRLNLAGLRLGNRKRGEARAMSKLTAAKVREIRERAAKGEKYSVMAPEYGVCASLISEVARRLRWKHVP